MIENETHRDILIKVSFGFIFNIRVNPDIPDENRQESSPGGQNCHY